MKETDLNERLDEMDIMEVAHDPGVYVLEVDVPSDIDEIRERWDEHLDVRPEDETLERIAGSEFVYYVGSTSDVYRRLCDHVDGESRQSSFLSIFPPIELRRVWMTNERSTTEEYNRAVWLAQMKDVVAWSDGVLYG